MRFSPVCRGEEGSSCATCAARAAVRPGVTSRKGPLRTTRTAPPKQPRYRKFVHGTQTAVLQPASFIRRVMTPYGPIASGRYGKSEKLGREHFGAPTHFCAKIDRAS